MSQLFPGLIVPKKRSIFVSYHHADDQRWYNYISNTFSRQYGIITDNSLDRLIDSDQSEYVMRAIRERHISGTSCTLVLCGKNTFRRKFVDWEIKTTLDQRHGLVAVVLPTAALSARSKILVPSRLYENICSGYARHCFAAALDASTLRRTIEDAIRSDHRRIRNTAPMMSRNT